MRRRFAPWFAPVTCVLASQAGCASLALQIRAHGVIFHDATMSQLTTQNVVGSREGRSCAHSVLGLFTWGDGGVAAAARNGGVELVATADEESFGVLGVYARVCSVVNGTGLAESASPTAPAAPGHEAEGAARGHAHVHPH